MDQRRAGENPINDCPIVKGAIGVGLMFLMVLTATLAHADLSGEEGGIKRATFAGGCFWCMEEAFDKVEGVLSTTSGYIGGHLEDPNYDQVSAGGTGHTEAVEIRFDPEKISYAALLDVFWKNVDPTTASRQFCDVGTQYRSEIFYHDEMQKQFSENSKSVIEKNKLFPDPIVTKISPASNFYKAEEYHQDFYKKNPLRYKFYKYNCGRAKRLKALWGKSTH